MEALCSPLAPPHPPHTSGRFGNFLSAAAGNLVGNVDGKTVSVGTVGGLRNASAVAVVALGAAAVVDAGSAAAVGTAVDAATVVGAESDVGDGSAGAAVDVVSVDVDADIGSAGAAGVYADVDADDAVPEKRFGVALNLACALGTGARESVYTVEEILYCWGGGLMAGTSLLAAAFPCS